MVKEETEELQSISSLAWDNAHQKSDGIRYPHECLVIFINLIKQWEYLANLKALDIGFGSFANLKMCYEHGYQIAGIEVSQTALTKTRGKLGDWKIPFSGKLFTPPNIPFADGEFSLVYSEQAIYYNLDFEKIISEIKRVLAPGGAFYLSFFTPKHWYFRYSERFGNGMAKWSVEMPVKAIRGLPLRYFDSKKELRRTFPGFKYLRVDDYGFNMLGVEHWMWIVTGFKDGKNLRKFNWLNHYTK